jgi:hypothetical protein
MYRLLVLSICVSVQRADDDTQQHSGRGGSVRSKCMQQRSPLRIQQQAHVHSQQVVLLGGYRPASSCIAAFSPQCHASKNSAAAKGSSQAPRLLQLPALTPPCTRMSSGSFWSDACAVAEGKPLQTLLIDAYASCSVTVRQLRCCCRRCRWQPATISLQRWIASFVCNALRRLRRISQAPWQAGQCFACGGGWTRRGGSACGGCTAGSLH